MSISPSKVDENRSGEAETLDRETIPPLSPVGQCESDQYIAPGPSSGLGNWICGMAGSHFNSSKRFYRPVEDFFAIGLE